MNLLNYNYLYLYEIWNGIEYTHELMMKVIIINNNV